MTEKTCTKCGETKAFSEFNKQSAAPDKLNRRCKVCVRAYHSKYYQDNKEKIDQQKKDWEQANLEHHKRTRREYYEAHREAILKEKAEYYQEKREHILSYKKTYNRLNRDNRNLIESKRYASKKNRTPPWLTKAQEIEIKSFYWLAQDLNKVTEGNYHVDHIIPLQGDGVCGLHVPWNLQVLPADINIAKGNKYNAEAEQIMERHPYNGC